MNQYTADEAARWINDALLTVCCRYEGRWRCYLPLSHSPTRSLSRSLSSFFLLFPQPLPFLLAHAADVFPLWSISPCSVKEESDSDGITPVCVHLPGFDSQHECSWSSFRPVHGGSVYLVTSAGRPGSPSALVWLPPNGAEDRHMPLTVMESDD